MRPSHPIRSPSTRRKDDEAKTRLPQDRHQLERLDGQVLADEQDAVVREVEALAAAAVVPQGGVPAAVALLDFVCVCVLRGAIDFKGWVGLSWLVALD